MHAHDELAFHHCNHSNVSALLVDDVKYLRVLYPSQLCNVACFAFTLYMFAAFETFAHRSQLRSTSRSSRVLLLIAETAMLWTVLRLIAVECLVWVGHARRGTGAVGDRWCAVTTYTATLAYSVGMMCAEVFLWKRQRYIYSQPMFAHLNGRVCRLASWLVIVLIAVDKVGTVTLFTHSAWCMSDTYGCVQPMFAFRNFVPSIALELLQTASQCVLLALFCHPLRYNLRNKRALVAGSRNTNPRTHRRVHGLLKYATAAVLVSTVAKLAAGLTVYGFYLGHWVNSIFTYSIFNLSLSAHMFALVITYGKPGQMFFWCYPVEDENVDAERPCELQQRQQQIPTMSSVLKNG